MGYIIEYIAYGREETGRWGPKSRALSNIPGAQYHAPPSPLLFNVLVIALVDTGSLFQTPGSYKALATRQCLVRSMGYPT